MTSNNSFEALWQPVELGDIHLPHRLVMAPMTRSRAMEDGTPTAMNALYYAQRASMGLIISEGTQPSEDGQGYLFTPGIYTAGHIEGWKVVTDAVHAAGGKIFIQLMHVGRIAHPDNTSHGRQPVAPSAIAAAGEMFTMQGLKPLALPRALSPSEIATTIEDYALAADAAIASGADGVEIHAAHGYLPHQFLATNTNRRTDDYGGSIANRIRFTIEVASAVADRIGSARTGIRLSPGNPFNDIVEDDISELYPQLVEELASLNLAYLHLTHLGNEDLAGTIRTIWSGALMINRPGADIETKVKDVQSGLAEAITAGMMSLANPDLVERIRSSAALNAADPETFYGGSEKGYTDYPALSEAGI